jgi:hypothetical protein
VELSSIVKNAYHALAIDEHREDYRAILWEPKFKWNQVMEQVWFMGAHADVGGGYPAQPLSDITLFWMQEKAKAAGLEIDPQRRPRISEKTLLAAQVTDSFDSFALGLYKLFKKKYYRTVLATLFGNESVDRSYRDRRRKDITYKPKNPGLDLIQ